MANTRNRQIDWGGMDLIVRDLKLASKPRATQTDITTTDLTAVAGVTAGTITASKAVIVDSSRNITNFAGVTATTFTGNLTGNVTGNIAGGITRTAYTYAAGPNTLLGAADSGALVVLNAAAGFTVNLPAPVVGLYYDVTLRTTVTSSTMKIITDAATTFLTGTILPVVTATGVITPTAANGTTHRAINMNGSTTGGLIGTTLRFFCTAATLWEVSGTLPFTGSIGAIFATS